MIVLEANFYSWQWRRKPACFILGGHMMDSSFLLSAARFGLNAAGGLYLVWAVWSLPFLLLQFQANMRCGSRRLYRVAVKYSMEYRIGVGTWVIAAFLFCPMPVFMQNNIFINTYILVYETMLFRLLWRKRRAIRNGFFVRE